MVISDKLLIDEIQDEKNMAEHISSSGGRLYWYNTSDSEHVAGLFKISVNDPDERYFGAMTSQIQYYGKIELANA